MSRVVLVALFAGFAAGAVPVSHHEKAVAPMPAELAALAHSRLSADDAALARGSTRPIVEPDDPNPLSVILLVGLALALVALPILLF